MEVSQSQSGAHTKKNYPSTSQYGPLSARGELQSHPLAGQAQACGHLTQVDGPGARWHLSWPLADTTAKKKNLTTFLDSCRSSLRLSMLFFSVSFKRETSNVMMLGLPVENAKMTVSETAVPMAAAARVLLAA